MNSNVIDFEVTEWILDADYDLFDYDELDGDLV